MTLALPQEFNYLFLQDLCDYSHINSATITPPWCLTLHVSGHTFNKDFGISIPEYVAIYRMFDHRKNGYSESSDIFRIWAL